MTPPPGNPPLFPPLSTPAPPDVHIANIDGASRGNPGPASYAVIIKDPSGREIFRLGKELGRQTNNVAEYYALLAALDYAVSHGIKSLRVRSDSELLVRQIQGRYKVKSSDLKPLHERAFKLAKQLEYFVAEHVPREMNRDADALANLALDHGDPSGAANRGSTDPKSGPGANSGSFRSSPPASRTIRARFVNGALVPSEPVDLPEGIDVLVTIRKP